MKYAIELLYQRKNILDNARLDYLSRGGSNANPAYEDCVRKTVEVESAIELLEEKQRELESNRPTLDIKITLKKDI